MDLVVEDLVIVEIKSVDAISPVHQAQIISYLKLSGKSLGLLINFNVVHLREGIRRFVNGIGWKERQSSTTKATKVHEEISNLLNSFVDLRALRGSRFWFCLPEMGRKGRQKANLQPPRTLRCTKEFQTV